MYLDYIVVQGRNRTSNRISAIFLLFVLGCYIRAYQHSHGRGYSSICSETYGCSVTPSYYGGVLTENEASSAYCYCDTPSKFAKTRTTAEYLP